MSKKQSQQQVHLLSPTKTGLFQMVPLLNPSASRNAMQCGGLLTAATQSPQ